jgi:hypothetical protein
VPGTPEAIAVHMIENMDAKLMIALGYCRGEAASSEGNWSEYIKAFGVRLYRPDVAPAEANDGGDAAPAPQASKPVEQVPTRGVNSAGIDAAGVDAMPLLNNPLFETAQRKL